MHVRDLFWRAGHWRHGIHLTAAMNLPIDYMEVIDAQGYDWHGITGAFLADALISAAACVLPAIVLRRQLFPAPSVAAPA